MPKFYGKIGYGEALEQAPGVWEDTIVEYIYYGDVIRNSRTLGGPEEVISDLTVGVSISIVADAYLREHFHTIRYIQWSGALWKVTNVDVQGPRLILRLGGVYNGPTS